MSIPLPVSQDILNNITIVHVPVTELKARKNNARTHSKKQIRQVADSMVEFGVVTPVITDQNGVLIAGHGRLAAAKLLGLKTLPTVYVGHLTPEKARLLALADNKIALNAGWDPEILKFELQELATLIPGLDFTITGFEIPEIDLLLLGDGPKEEPQEDLQALARDRAVSRKGDVWILGNHRIICGDALDPEDYRRLLNGSTAQACFTDPPYNVRVQDIVGLGKTQHDEFAMGSGEMTKTEFTDFLTAALTNIRDVMMDGGIIFACMDWRHLGEMLAAGEKTGFQLLNLCIWNKSNGGMGSLYRSKHEEVFVFKHGTAPHINNVRLGAHGRYRTNVWDYAGQNVPHADREAELGSHPTVKPVALVADAILDCSAPGGIVLDPFGGSGTTLIAAEKTGRHARLIEYEPVYVDLTVRRWQKLTGKAAVHAGTGKTFNETEQEATHDGHE